VLDNLADGRDGIGGGGGGGGGCRHVVGAEFLPTLVIGGGGGGGGCRYELGGDFLPVLLVSERIDALAKLISEAPSFFTLDSSNLSAMSFCMSLNLGLWCSPIESFSSKKKTDSFPRCK